MKGVARSWFVERAVRRGVPWYELTSQFDVADCEVALERVRDASLAYPAYYLMPFHGYDGGNLEWNAARELEASTLAMSLGYWPDATAEDAASRMREAFVNALPGRPPRAGASTLVDVGCSVGISTADVLQRLSARGWRFGRAMGVDLSPQFLAVASMRQAADDESVPRIDWVHAPAETMSQGLGRHSADIATVCFVFHEMPSSARRRVLAEIHRLLRPGGWVGVLDLDPIALRARLDRSTWRRWAFEVTEPHIFEYYRADVAADLSEAGFVRVRTGVNDPVNRWWWAQCADARDAGLPCDAREEAEPGRLSALERVLV